MINFAQEYHPICATGSWQYNTLPVHNCYMLMYRFLKIVGNHRNKKSGVVLVLWMYQECTDRCSSLPWALLPAWPSRTSHPFYLYSQHNTNKSLYHWVCRSWDRKMMRKLLDVRKPMYYCTASPRIEIWKLRPMYNSSEKPDRFSSALTVCSAHFSTDWPSAFAFISEFDKALFATCRLPVSKSSHPIRWAAQRLKTKMTLQIEVCERTYMNIHTNTLLASSKTQKV